MRRLCIDSRDRGSILAGPENVWYSLRSKTKRCCLVLAHLPLSLSRAERSRLSSETSQAVFVRSVEYCQSVHHVVRGPAQRCFSTLGFVSRSEVLDRTAQTSRNNILLCKETADGVLYELGRKSMLRGSFVRGEYASCLIRSSQCSNNYAERSDATHLQVVVTAIL